MQVLYFYQYFSTAKGAWGTRAHEFARRWVAAGDEVTVITSVYDKSDLSPGKLVDRLNVDGIDVRVINVVLSNKHGRLRRALTFVVFMAVSCWYAVSRPADVVLCSSGPVTVGIPGVAAKVLRGRPLVFEVRDLFSEGLRQVGLIRSTLALGVFEWFERFFCRSADRVVALSSSMAQWIIGEWGIERVSVVPNAADNDLFGVPAAQETGEDLPAPESGERWAVFTGTIGIANNCGILLDAAEILARRGIQHIRIVLIGDGKERPRLEAEALRRNLENVLFVDLMPKQDLVPWIQQATVSLLVLKPIPVFDTVSPNKLFDALAAGLPIIQTTQGWIKDLLEEHECGLTVQGDDPRGLADAILKIVDDDELRRRMSENSRRVARGLFDRDQLAENMRQILHEAMDG